MEINKNLVAIVAVACMTALQVTAWALGFNGQVFAFTSAVIGAMLGFVFGIEIRSKRGE